MNWKHRLLLGLLTAGSIFANFKAIDFLWPLWAHLLLMVPMIALVHLFAYSFDEVERRHGWGRYYKKEVR